jgi:hypothetical protein
MSIETEPSATDRFELRAACIAEQSVGGIVVVAGGQRIGSPVDPVTPRPARTAEAARCSWSAAKSPIDGARQFRHHTS